MGSSHFEKTSSSVLQRCSPFFLLLPSLFSPRALFFLLDSALLLVPTTHSVAQALSRSQRSPEVLLSSQPKRLRNTSTTLPPLPTPLWSQVLMFTLLPRMPSLPGWVSPLDSQHTRPPSQGSTSSSRRSSPSRTLWPKDSYSKTSRIKTLPEMCNNNYSWLQ